MAKSRVIVEFPDRPAYAVRIGGDVAAQLGADLRAAGVQADRCLVVCDSDSSQRCLPTVKAALAGAGFRVADITVPPVEPSQAWSCMGELLGALSQLGLSADAPVVVCADSRVSALAAFAFGLDGARRPLVVVPASLAAALGTLGIDSLEVDTGLSAPIVARTAPAFGCVAPDLLACADEEEADRGLYALEQAAAYCDAEFTAWLGENLGDVAAYDEDACVLAIAQVLAARADAIGTQILARR